MVIKRIISTKVAEERTYDSLIRDISTMNPGPDLVRKQIELGEVKDKIKARRQK